MARKKQAKKRNKRQQSIARKKEQPLAKEAVPVSDSMPEAVNLEMVEHRQELFFGVLPHPNHLRQYDEIVPGGADRIITMVEKQGDHRRGMEKKNIGGDLIKSYFGLVAGLIVALAMIGAGTYVIVKGHDWAGATMIGTVMVSLVSVFVYGTRSRRDERSEQQTSLLRTLRGKR